MEPPSSLQSLSHSCCSPLPKDLSWLPLPLAREEEDKNHSHGCPLPLPLPPTTSSHQNGVPSLLSTFERNHQASLLGETPVKVIINLGDHQQALLPLRAHFHSSPPFLSPAGAEGTCEKMRRRYSHTHKTTSSPNSEYWRGVRCGRMEICRPPPSKGCKQLSSLIEEEL